MSTPQWQNLPAPGPGNRGWQGFSADPRNAQYAHLRASDADRANASAILADALAEGRLDSVEYDQRLSQATSAKSLGELVPVLSDLTVESPAAAQPVSPAPVETRHPGGMIGPLPTWWIGLAVLFNVIWLMTSFSAGRPLYYWPMWPMMGTFVPVFVGWLSGAGRRSSAPPQNPQLPSGQERDLR